MFQQYVISCSLTAQLSIHQYVSVCSCIVICSCGFMSHNISKQSLWLHLFVKCTRYNFSLAISCKCYIYFCNFGFFIACRLVPGHALLSYGEYMIASVSWGFLLKIITENHSCKFTSCRAALCASCWYIWKSETSLELKLYRIQKNKKGKFIASFCFCILRLLYG